MIKKLIYCMLAVLSFCLVSVSEAAPTIDKAKSRGAYLIKIASGTKLDAGIIVDYGDNFYKDDCVVSMTIPYEGVSIPLVRDEMTDVGEERGYFYILAFPPEEAMKGSNLTGNYVFTLSDKQGNVFDTYSEFFVPYRDEALNGMGDFSKDEILPKNGAIVKQKDLVFQWNKVKGAVIYQVKILKGQIYDPSRVALFRDVYKAETKENQLRMTHIKLAPGTYWWRLQAYHEDGVKRKNVVRFTLEDDRLPTFTIE